jgi:nitroreductase
MDLIEVIRRRRSVRKYRPEPVPKKDLYLMLEAARLAPSGVNSQPWKFKVITDPDTKEQVFKASRSQFQIREAPAVILVCADTMAYSKELKIRYKQLMDDGILTEDDIKYAGVKDLLTEDEEKELAAYEHRAVLNTAIATEHMALTATSVGLGTCWVHLFDKEEIRRIFKLPSWLIPVTLLTVGYPEELPEPRPRKSMEEILL